MNMMKNALTAAAACALVSGVSFGAQAQDDFTLQLKWVTQGQFAGYFVADEQGFYEEAGLNVTIQPGGPDIAPPQVIAAGGADAIVEWMPAALAARERGVDLVNVAQIFDRSGMMLTCMADSGISSPEDFPGHTLGVWFAGNEYPFLSWMARLGFSFEGPDAEVTVLRQGFNVDPLLQGQASCISTMIYNEYWQIIDAGIPEEDLVTFFYEDQGVATLEDGIYVLAENLEDEEFVDKLSRFIAASLRGWEYAAENLDEAAQTIVDRDPSGAATFDVQRRQIENVVGLITSETPGYLDPEAFDQTVEVLLSGDSAPVITEDPGEAAWSHAAYDQMADD
ncbi:ABC transporter substrate-binding protein [Fodinicurvata sp. EGI_FJ10296]|uniref:ABC transporter substrate-binding protein n=1 Tax=Fodinicurvata sp. EGI_FJ10296 TaxID=3231908 RepID=UPI0034530D14